MDRLASDHSGDIAFRGMDADPLSVEQRGIHAAHGDEAQVAPLVDVIDHEPDFVHMPGEHHAQLTLRVLHVILVAVHVFVYLVHIGLGIRGDHFLDRLLEAGRAGRAEEGLEKIEGLLAHSLLLVASDRI